MNTHKRRRGSNSSLLCRMVVQTSTIKIILLLTTWSVVTHVFIYMKITKEVDQFLTNDPATMINRQMIQSEQEGQRSSHSRCSDKIHTPFYLEARFIEEITDTKRDDYNIREGFKVFVNRQEKSYERRNLYNSCVFTPESNNGPIPVLFLADGRSGSSNTWLTLSKLAGGDQREAKEALGSDQDQVRIFLNSMKSAKEGSWWVREHMCEVTKLNCASAITGFQWKPYENTWTLPSAQGILKEIARHNKVNHEDGGIPKIKVIYMTRNPLDVLISRQKHRTKLVSAHCSQDNIECLKNHTTYNMTLPTTDLIQNLRHAKNQVTMVENTLQTLKIDYYRTTYEKLYNSNDANEWMKIFKYLGRGPRQGLKREDVDAAFPLAKTSNRSLESLLLNYEDVKNVLEGTEFFVHLLSER